MGRNPKFLLHRWACVRCGQILFEPPAGTGIGLPRDKVWTSWTKTHVPAQGCGGLMRDITVLGVDPDVVHSTYALGGKSALSALMNAAEEAWLHREPPAPAKRGRPRKKPL